MEINPPRCIDIDYIADLTATSNIYSTATSNIYSCTEAC